MSRYCADSRRNPAISQPLKLSLSPSKVVCDPYLQVQLHLQSGKPLNRDIWVLLSGLDRFCAAATETRNLEGQEFQVRKADPPCPEPQPEGRVCARAPSLWAARLAALGGPLCRAPACCQMSSSRGVRPPTHPTPALRTRRSLSFRRAARYPTPGPRTNLSSGPGGTPSKWPSCYNDRISSGLLPCPHPPGHGHLHAENPVTAGLQRYLNLHQN